MILKIRILHLLFLFTLVAVGTLQPAQAQPGNAPTLTSPDTALCRTFDWARTTALRYAHDAGDPVGCWYEAALPGREAFCMRDASHQSIGAEVLGLARHNANMFSKFAAAITPEREWCSLWEIDRRNAPAQADYIDDEQFWYNLGGGPDVVFACERLYRWTGDARYLRDTTMLNFYEKTLGEFVTHWQLAPEQLFYRVRNMHTPLPFDDNCHFNHARGIPSYAEDVQGFSVGADLVAALYGAHEAYARLLDVLGDARATIFRKQAAAYRDQLNAAWWEPGTETYHPFWDSNRGLFMDGNPQMEQYVVWFGAAEPERAVQVLRRQAEGRNRSAEHDSYVPTLLYRYRLTQEGYDYLLSLPHIRRCEYPEVSFGAVEAITTGVMGIAPCAVRGIVQTLAQLSASTPWAAMDRVSLLGTRIGVRHEGNMRTVFTNHDDRSLIWRAAFYGVFGQIVVNGQRLRARQTTDAAGNTFSYTDVPIGPGRKAVAVAEKN